MVQLYIPHRYKSSQEMNCSWGSLFHVIFLSLSSKSSLLCCDRLRMLPHDLPLVCVSSTLSTSPCATWRWPWNLHMHSGALGFCPHSGTYAKSLGQPQFTNGFQSIRGKELYMKHIQICMQQVFSNTIVESQQFENNWGYGRIDVCFFIHLAHQISKGWKEGQARSPWLLYHPSATQSRGQHA